MAHDVYALLGITAAAAIASLIFDLFRVIKNNTKIPTAVMDILFWLVASVLMCAALLYFNNGIMRGYEIVGAIVGALLYFLTISKPVIKVFTVIFQFFLKKLKFICKILLTPLQFLYKILYKIYNCSSKIFGKGN